MMIDSIVLTMSFVDEENDDDNDNDGLTDSLGVCKLLILFICTLHQAALVHQHDRQSF
jgi:hypothetical protein